MSLWSTTNGGETCSVAFAITRAITPLDTHSAATLSAVAWSRHCTPASRPTPQRLEQRSLQLQDALGQPLLLEDVEVRHRGGAGRRVPRVGDPVAEHQLGV